VGQGAYGEVWLARTATGAYRAVKVIYREDFPDERPYEREFRGMLRFEPISRTHESQVDILHVGRNDADGYFYYVMELADDSNAERRVKDAELREAKGVPSGPRPVISNQNPLTTNQTSLVSSQEWVKGVTDPETYEPKTLKSELRRVGRLPLDRCLEIGLALTTALEHLHQNGLVHRDVKPSNIVFINGVPKLADIGLVTGVDVTFSEGGTDGYIPPERHGAPTGDIYSLGKVLYEACTGKDRFDFPEPPTLWESSEDEEALREFHLILLRACETTVSQRYQSVREMRADMVLLQGGKSIRRLRTLERQLGRLRRAGATVSALTLLAVGACVWQRHETRLVRESLWQSYLAQASANQTSRDAGRRFGSLGTLEKAAAIQRSLELRNHAIACLILPDLRPSGNLHDTPTSSTFNDFDQNFQLYARLLKNSAGQPLEISLRRVADDQLLTRLPNQSLPRGSWCGIRMSPDATALVVYDDRDFHLWHLHGSNEPTELLVVTNGCWPAVDFSADAHWVALASSNGWVTVCDLPADHGRRGFAAMVPRSLRFSPDGRKLAVSGADQAVIELRDAAGGELLQARIQAPDFVEAMDWHPDGKLLAGGCRDGQVYIWDTETNSLPIVLRGHMDLVHLVAFTHGGDLLATYGYDNSIRLWDTWKAEQCAALTSGSMTLHFSQDDHWLGVASRAAARCLLEVATGRECRRLPSRHKAEWVSASCSANGRLVAALSGEGVTVWDLWKFKQVASWSVPAGQTVMFHPDDGSLLVCGTNGLFRWPISWRENAHEVVVHLGPKEKLHGTGLGRAALNRDGSLLAAVEVGKGARVFDLMHGRIARTIYHTNTAYVAISPNGQWLATGEWRSVAPAVRVWNIKTGQMEKELPISRHAALAFSPSGDSLVASTFEECTFWEPGSWKAQSSAPRGAVAEWPGETVFSPDGSMVAFPHLRRGIRLLRGPHGPELATLATADQWALCFTPDSSRIIAFDENDGALRVWDLRLIRQELASMNLDWELSPLPAAATEAAKPLVVELDK
jgi:WD40 repeat protein